jgi:ElaB/YqjD/DUF883 family membrane-anchored ribosome-binding protein
MSPQRDEQLSRHYEREAEATRHSLANSLNEINQRLTPGQVFDEVLTYAKGGGGTFARAFSNAVRENPMPSLLIGTGCMMFLSEKLGVTQKLAEGRRAGARRAAHAYEADEEGAGIAQAAKERVSSAAASVKQGVAAVGDTILDASMRARETARETSQDMSEGVAQSIEQVKQRAETVRHQIAEKAARTGEQARMAGRQVKDTATELLHEQPMLMAGIGLALGAAIAALLPTTRVEDEWMGETSDSLKKQIGKTAAQQFDTAKNTAGELVKEAKNMAEREGLTSVGAAAEKIRKVAASGDGPGMESELRSESRWETGDGTVQPFQKP